MLTPPKCPEHVNEIVLSIFDVYMQMPENLKPNKNSFYITIFDTLTGGMVAGDFGDLGPIDSEIFLPQTIEKINRLERNMQTLCHVSSWQSCNIADNQYGGAVLAKTHIISVAGLSQLGDEAISLAIAFKLGLISLKKTLEIAGISGNALCLALMDAIEKSDD
jgi:hypothetical protein